jgi:hypothetical protein
MLPRALLQGDRSTILQLATKEVARLSVVDTSWAITTHLGILSAARADATTIRTFGEIDSWAGRVVHEVDRLEVKQAEKDLPFAAEIAKAREAVRVRARHCQYLVADMAKGAWTEPGALVRLVCQLGEFHLAGEIAHLTGTHGDHLAGRNVRTSMIRGLDTLEAVRLSADIVAKRPNHYSFNTRTGCLMDLFVATGDSEVLTEARACLRESLRLTPIDGRPSSYTFAALSRYVRVVDDDRGWEIHHLADCASDLGVGRPVRCLPACQIDNESKCQCPKTIDSLWRRVGSVLRQAGLTALSQSVVAREPDLVKAALQNPLRTDENRPQIYRDRVEPRVVDLALDPF